ncbi:MAG: glycosyltransferase family 2 protein [Acidimicrobiia bacterium]
MSRVTLLAVVSEAEPDPSPLVASLHRQTDSDWELIVVDTTGGQVRRSHRRRKGSLRVLDRPGHAGPVGAAEALEEASGDLVGFVGPGDVLEPAAIATIAQRAGADVDLIYTDEDRITVDGDYVDPFYKPGWSPDRLRCQPYTGRLTLLRRELANEVGGVRTQAGSAYEWDLVLRASERVRGVEQIAEVLCHRRMSSQLDDGDQDAEQQVLEEHLDRTGFPANPVRDERPRVWHLRPALRDEPLVSIVVPTAGRSRMVHGAPMNVVVNCVEHLVRRSTYRNYEIVCVAGDDLRDETRRTLGEIAGERFRFIANPGSFNFAHTINLGTMHARGDYLLLLNDDTEVITPDWIEAMLMYAQDPGVGAVGAKLLFADGRLQHAGIIGVGHGAAGHPYYGFPGDHEGYAANLLVPSNYLAVTAACMLTRRDCFEEVGGFATGFPLNYNDLDYCLKLHHRGHRIVFTPEACLYHFEWSSRISGSVESDELDVLKDRWGAVLERDPFYNPKFLPSVDFLPPIRSAAEARRSGGAPSPRTGAPVSL